MRQGGLSRAVARSVSGFTACLRLSACLRAVSGSGPPQPRMGLGGGLSAGPGVPGGGNLCALAGGSLDEVVDPPHLVPSRSGADVSCVLCCVVHMCVWVRACDLGHCSPDRSPLGGELCGSAAPQGLSPDPRTGHGGSLMTCLPGLGLGPCVFCGGVCSVTCVVCLCLVCSVCNVW